MSALPGRRWFLQIPDAASCCHLRNNTNHRHSQEARLGASIPAPADRGDGQPDKKTRRVRLNGGRQGEG